MECLKPFETGPLPRQTSTGAASTCRLAGRPRCPSVCWSSEGPGRRTRPVETFRDGSWPGPDYARRTTPSASPPRRRRPRNSTPPVPSGREGPLRVLFALKLRHARTHHGQAACNCLAFPSRETLHHPYHAVRIAYQVAFVGQDPCRQQGSQVLRKITSVLPTFDDGQEAVVELRFLPVGEGGVVLIVSAMRQRR